MRNLKLSLCLASLLSSGAAFAEVPGWKISESSGQVAIVSPGVSKVAHRGGAVAIGEIVSTGTNGRAVLVRGEEYLIVSPNTRIRVADPAQSGGMTQIIEIVGNTIFKIKKMATPHFAVQTPYLAAVVKGTTFSVTVSDKGATVQVVEGRVEVSTRDGGASYMVLPGDIGSVTAAAPMRLNVEGRESKAIMSTGPSAAAPLVVPEPEEPQSNAAASSPNPTAPVATIIAAVGEGPVTLEALSGGLVKGDTAMVALATTTVAAPASVVSPSATPAIPAEVVAALPPTPVVNAPAETVAALPPTSAVAVANVNPTPIAATLATPVDVVAPVPTPVNATAVATAALPTAPAPAVITVAAPVAPAVTAPVVVAVAPPAPAPVVTTPTPAVSAPVVPVVVAVVTPVSTSNSGPGNSNAGGNSGPGNNNAGGNGNGNCPNCTGANLPPTIVGP